MDISNFSMSTRRSDGGRAPCSSSFVAPILGKGRSRRRVGKQRKRRAGVRKNQLKCERLAKTHMRVVYWNCRSLEQRGVVAEKLAYSGDILCLQETKLGEHKSFKVLGYQEPVYNRTGHGQIILVADGIKHKALDLHRWSSENLHLVSIELQD